MQTLTINAYNQISNPTAFTYDNAGNETADATSAFQWYAAGNLEKAFGVTYSYDGDGNRVMKSNGKIYWRDPSGQVLDESDLSGNFTDEYVYFGGMRIAHRVVSSNSIYYYAPDALGTSRVIAGSAGTACYDSDFYPFGGEQNHLNTCGSNYKFNGQERDAESASANDYFGARYNSNILGRFLSPDPSGLYFADQSNPQSLNFYVLTRDNPVSFIDPSGLSCVTVDNGDSADDGDGEGCVVAGVAPGNGDPPGTEITTSVTYVDGDDGQVSASWLEAAQGLFAKAKSAVCSLIPDGRVTSVSNYWGAVGSVGASADMVINYNSGETSGFLTGGGQAGWNGAVSVPASTGVIYGLGNSNNSFQGRFTGGNLSLPTPVPFVGVTGSFAKAGNVKVLSLGGGAAAIGKVQAGGTYSNSSSPQSLGRFAGFDPSDYGVYLLKKGC